MKEEIINTIEKDEKIVHFKLRITYGKTKPNINDLKITHSKLYNQVYASGYMAGLELGEQGQYHTQGILTLDIKKTQQALKIKKLIYKSGDRLESNRDLRKIVKTILNIKGKGNKFISMSPLAHPYETEFPKYKKYCAKENIRISGDPEEFKNLNAEWNKYTIEKNNNRKCKYREDKNIKELIKKNYIKAFRKKQKEDLSQNTLDKYFDVSGNLKIEEFPFDRHVALESILDTFTGQPKYTLRKTNAETYYQICLRLHKGAYKAFMKQRVEGWLGII